MIKSENLFSVQDYVASLTDSGFLQDKLCKRNYVLEGENKTPLFPPHLTPTQIHDGIKSGKFLQGSFLASRENCLEGSVNVEGREKFVSFVVFLRYILLRTSMKSNRRPFYSTCRYCYKGG